MPTISVILPIYKVEAFIKSCIKSLLDQTFKDFECICVDDASPDQSVARAKEIIGDDRRFRFIHQENKMLGGARNTGIEHASGAYLMFLDSDDYLHPRALELLHTAIIEHDADIASALLQKTAELYDGHVPEIEKYKTELFVDPLHHFIRNRKIATSVCSRLYRRELVQEVRFIEKIHFEDKPWTAEVFARSGKLVFLHVPLYFYYQNPASIMRSNWTTQKTLDFVTMLRSIYESTREQRPDRLDEMCRYALSPAIKMTFNKILRSDRAEHARLWEHARPHITQLYKDGCISYKGLKMKHKLRLWWLMRSSAK